MKEKFNLNSFELTGGPEGNGGNQHDRKGGGGGGGGGPLNFRPGCKKYFKERLIYQFQYDRWKRFNVKRIKITAQNIYIIHIKKIK